MKPEGIARQVMVVHPFFGKGGGAEVVAANILEWLVTVKQVRATLYMCSTENDSPGLDLISHLLRGGILEIKKIALPLPLRLTRGMFQAKVAFLHRRARAVAAEFHLCISTYNEENFGRTGFQYIHHPVFLTRRVKDKYHMAELNEVFEWMPPVERVYRMLVGLYGGTDATAFRQNVTAVNSTFIKTVIADEYGITATVIPPLFREPINRLSPPWSTRRLRFVSVGRFSGDKKLFELVDLYTALHGVWSEAEFMIVGRKSDERYYEMVIERARIRGLPLMTVTDADEDGLVRILETSKVYIGPKPFEHFGIAIVDAINAGCIPFVHDSGGQREIVNSAELRYASVPELVARVSALLASPTRAEILLRELRNGIASLTRDDFFSSLEMLVGPLLNNAEGIDN